MEDTKTVTGEKEGMLPTIAPFCARQWIQLKGAGQRLNNIGNLLILTMETNRLVGQLDLPSKMRIYFLVNFLLFVRFALLNW